ncbi:hypothetical protein LPJ57_007219, partial [Coemansia sp. RSA 486]
FPLNMSPSYAQSRSPLVHSSQSQSLTQLRPHQLGPASRVPIMTAPMAMPGSGLKQQQQISPSIPMSHAGLGFSPLVHQGPSAQMFFNPMSMHTPPATSSLMPPPFQQQMPTGSWSPSKPHLAGAVSSVAGSDMMQQTAPLGSITSTMLARIIQRNTRIAAPLQAAIGQSRMYADDKFKERETAAENQYIHKRQEEQIAALKKQLDEVQKHADKLRAEIDGKSGSEKK